MKNAALQAIQNSMAWTCNSPSKPEQAVRAWLITWEFLTCELYIRCEPTAPENNRRHIAAKPKSIEGSSRWPSRKFPAALTHPHSKKQFRVRRSPVLLICSVILCTHTHAVERSRLGCLLRLSHCASSVIGNSSVHLPLWISPCSDGLYTRQDPYTFVLQLKVGTLTGSAMLLYIVPGQIENVTTDIQPVIFIYPTCQPILSYPTTIQNKTRN